MAKTFDGPPTLERSGSEHRVGRLHPLPFWKGRGLGSGLRTPSSQEGDRGVETNIEVMPQLTLQIDSPSLLEQLKNVLSLMRGVKIVSDSPVSRSAALEDVPNAETLAAMKEAESGHDAGVVRVDSLESFMASMEE
jgi:hypothetical protein